MCFHGRKILYEGQGDEQGASVTYEAWCYWKYVLCLKYCTIDTVDPGNGRNATIPAAGKIQIEEESRSQMAHEVADLLMRVEFCSHVNAAIKNDKRDVHASIKKR